MAPNLKILALLASALCLSTMIGCAGNGTVSQETGCGGEVSGASISIQYPARSKTSSLNTPLSSALSARIVLTGASATGTDVTLNVNRDAGTLGAHTETYNLPTLATGTFPASVTFYSGANQTGSIVGTAAASDIVSCSGQSFKSLSMTTKAQSVVVSPLTLTVGSGAVQLVFTVKDSSGTVIPVSAGSAIFTSTGSAATVTKDGMITPVKAGTVTVSASVDEITSPAATITVKAASTFGTGYHIVDLGSSAVNPTYAYLAPTEFGRLLSDSGKCVIYDPTASHYYLVDISKPSERTLLGGSDNQTLIFGIDAKGDVVGASDSPQHGLYWPASNYAAPVMLKGTDVTKATAINASGMIVGTGYPSGVYWTNSAATSQNLSPLLSDSAGDVYPRDLSSSGLIVGMSTDAHEVETPIYWTAPSATPKALPVGDVTFNGAATVCNDSGMIAGYNDTQYGPITYVWSSASADPTFVPGSAFPYGINNSGVIVGATVSASSPDAAFVYTTANGKKNLYDLVDSTRAGWDLRDAITINASGTILGQGYLNGVVHMFVAVPNP